MVLVYLVRTLACSIEMLVSNMGGEDDINTENSTHTCILERHGLP